jgi:Flp pilus assembly protein TadG
MLIMKVVDRRLRNRKGFALVLSVLLITVLLGVAVFAVDIGHANLVSAELQAAADAAALAGLAEFNAVGRSDSAFLEAKAFATNFKADSAHLTVAGADFTMGKCTVPCTPASNWTSPSSDTNAAMVTVRYRVAFAFGPVLGIRSHQSSATSIAVGGSGKTVKESSCVSPVVISFQQVLNQLGGGKKMTDTLTATDIASLIAATSSKAVTLDIPNGTAVSSLAPGEFYQINVPPAEKADGRPEFSGAPSASDFRNAFTCKQGTDSIGAGDWLQPISGQKANQAKQGVDNLGTPPVTILVALAGSFGNSPHAGCSGCFQVKYLGNFVISSISSKSVTGYFSSMTVPGGVVSSSNSPGPLSSNTRTRLAY